MTPGDPGGRAERDRLFYLIRPAAGGMRSHLRQLLRRFHGEYSVYLGAPPRDGLARSAGIRECFSFDLPLAEGISPLGDLLTFRRLCGLLRTVRPALIHIHGFKAALIGLPAARLARVPALVTVHNYPAHRAASALPALSRVPGALQAHYIAVSRSLADELGARGIPPDRISVIHNGIDPAFFARAAGERLPPGGEAGEVLVGTAARFAPQKGLPLFVQAAAILAPLFPRMRFAIAGDGPGRPALEQLSRGLGLRGRLSFHGHCTDLHRRLARWDIFVLPSLTEGFPLVLLEAAAAGCAVVAARVGGVPEMISGGVHGLLVPPADAVALARAIASLARDPAQARRLARACHERAYTRFSLERMLARTASVYERVARGSQHRLSPASLPVPGEGR